MSDEQGPQVGPAGPEQQLPPLPARPEEPPPGYPFWTYGDAALFFGLAIPSLLLGWAIVRGVVLLFGVRFTARAAGPLAEQFAGYLILFGALAVILRIEYGRPFWRSLGWTRIRMPLVWVVALGCATAFAVAFLGTLLRTPNTPNTLTEMMQGRTSLILMTVFGVTLGPISEELAFRGFLQPLLVRSLGAVPGILLAAIPFGFLHYSEYGNSWRHAVIVALAGAAFGWVKHSTGSTKASALMHSAYNALFFVVLISQRKDLP